MWHSNLLPPQLIVGEAKDFGPRFSSAESLVPVREASADLGSQSHRVHVPVEEPEAPAQAVEPAAVKAVQSQ